MLSTVTIAELNPAKVEIPVTNIELPIPYALPPSMMVIAVISPLEPVVILAVACSPTSE